MSKRITEVLEKYSQYEHIPYAKGLTCECGRCDFKLYDSPDDPGFVKPLIVGWCDTPIGFMGIFECPVCGHKFRFHVRGRYMPDKPNYEEFEHSLHKWSMLCQNYLQIKNKLEE